LFIPFNLDKDDLQQRATGVYCGLQPFAVITPEDIIVLDTGLGFERNYCFEDP